ncbi:MAG: TonB-dependent receptor [Bacteroidia bacterium]|nr:TonB-dependent receptor [Bacteroidia bacterium]
MKAVLILISIILFAPLGFTQNAFRQTIRGQVFDKNSRQPLAGVNVVLLNSNPLTGAVTNEYGEFKIQDVPVAKYDISFSFIGYHTIILPNVTLSSGKELVLKTEMEEKVIMTDEVVVKAGIRKDQPLNKMASVSARSFTVEETERYAGTWFDPARMVCNYAGVMAAGDQRNDIIIRGNSPSGVLYRLDGINIPNPNHFGTLGTTGGPISILNNNLLDNSDFFTGAFPAEYGNALAGVFDLHMRSGNNEKREYIAQVGLNGFEFGAEGPFSKNYKGSYLTSYRYSTLEFFRAMGISFGVSATPQYQDLSFKTDLPAGKLGNFSVFGVGGMSYTDILSKEQRPSDWTFGHPNMDIRFSTDMGVIGITHSIFLNPKATNSARLVSGIALSGSRTKIKADSAFTDKPSFQYYGNESHEIKYTLSEQYSKKINSKNYFSAGFTVDEISAYYTDSILTPAYQFFKQTDTRGKDITLIQSHIQWQHKITDNYIINGGLHYQHFTLNNDFAVEPRFNFKWKLNAMHSLSIGFGAHSQLQPMLFYFVETKLPDNSRIQTNKNLTFTRSNQVVLGYDFLITENMRLKTEVYYQQLLKIPVERKSSTFSIINFGSEFYQSRIDSLVNNGAGKNYGIELTVEHFLTKNYYYLFTASLFESKYTGSDSVERNTLFNGNYVVNALGGYKFKIGKYNSLSLDLKIVSAGGKRYIPIDTALSRVAHAAVYDFARAYEKRYPDYFRIDVRAGMKFNFPKFNMEFGIDVQNITNHRNFFLESYDPKENKVNYDYQLGLFYIFLVRFQF